MPFTYAPSSIATQGGKQQYRIKANAADLGSQEYPVVAPGDLIPIDVGFSGIAVGPESAYDRYELFYPDLAAPGAFQRIEFSVQYPLIGLFDVDLGRQAPGAGGQALQAFVRPIGYPNIRIDRQGAAAVVDAITDLIIYTGAQTPPFIPTKRSPINYQGPINLLDDPVDNDVNNFYLPTFGRRFMYVQIDATNALFAGGTLEYQVMGVRATNEQVTGSGSFAGKTSGSGTRFWELLAPDTILPAGTSIDSRKGFAYDAFGPNGQGTFDHLLVRVGSDIVREASDNERIYLTMEARD